MTDVRSSRLLDMVSSGSAREIAADEQVPFECRGCGGCCWNVEVPLTGHDLRTLAAGTGLDPKTFMDRYGQFTLGSGFLPVARLKLTAAGHCPFLQSDGRCGVHPARPLACRLFPFARIVEADGTVRWFKFGEDRHSGCASGPGTKRRTVGEYLDGEGAAGALEGECEFMDRSRDLIAQGRSFDLLESLFAYRSRIRALYGDSF